VFSWPAVPVTDWSTASRMAGTVLLHLFAGSLARRHPSLESNSKPIKSLYIPVPSPFPALESFIDKCVQAYNLDLFHCVPDTLDLSDSSSKRKENGHSNANWLGMNEGMSLPVESPEPTLNSHPHAGTSVGKSKGGEGMRRGLELYKQRYPDIDAILVGTRRGDPHGGASACLLSALLFYPFIDPCILFHLTLHALDIYLTSNSNIIPSKHDRPWLACVRAHKPNNQLGLCKCVDVSENIEGEVLCAL
jgi:hypothetical protein